MPDPYLLIAVVGGLALLGTLAGSFCSVLFVAVLLSARMRHRVAMILAPELFWSAPPRVEPGRASPQGRRLLALARGTDPAPSGSETGGESVACSLQPDPEQEPDPVPSPVGQGWPSAEWPPGSTRAPGRVVATDGKVQAVAISREEHGQALSGLAPGNVEVPSDARVHTARRRRDEPEAPELGIDRALAEVRRRAEDRAGQQTRPAQTPPEAPDNPFRVPLGEEPQAGPSLFLDPGEVDVGAPVEVPDDSPAPAQVRAQPAGAGVG